MSDHSHDQHEAHTGPVKTPKQMLLLSLASFIIPVFIIIGLVFYVTSANKTAPGSSDSEKSLAQRIQKVGTVEIRDANRPLKAGEEVYKAQCLACHAAGAAGAPKFADVIRGEAERESLAVRVIQRDAFSSSKDLRWDYRLILLSEVVSDFRNTDQFRAVFMLAAERLATGGVLVLNAFLAREGYTPDAAARELSQQCYSAIFTREEIAVAAVGLPLVLESDDSVHGYEKAHLPATAWPPTSWYESWVSGLDVFDIPREASPIELRWLVYRKAGSGVS